MKLSDINTQLRYYNSNKSIVRSISGDSEFIQSLRQTFPIIMPDDHELSVEELWKLYLLLIPFIKQKTEKSPSLMVAEALAFGTEQDPRIEFFRLASALYFANQLTLDNFSIFAEYTEQACQELCITWAKLSDKLPADFVTFENTVLLANNSLYESDLVIEGFLVLPVEFQTHEIFTSLCNRSINKNELTLIAPLLESTPHKSRAELIAIIDMAIYYNLKGFASAWLGLPVDLRNDANFKHLNQFNSLANGDRFPNAVLAVQMIYSTLPTHLKNQPNLDKLLANTDQFNQDEQFIAEYFANTKVDFVDQQEFNQIFDDITANGLKEFYKLYLPVLATQKIYLELPIHLQNHANFTTLKNIYLSHNKSHDPRINALQDKHAILVKAFLSHMPQQLQTQSNFEILVQNVDLLATYHLEKALRKIPENYYTQEIFDWIIQTCVEYKNHNSAEASNHIEKRLAEMHAEQIHTRDAQAGNDVANGNPQDGQFKNDFTAENEFLSPIQNSLEEHALRLQQKIFDDFAIESIATDKTLQEKINLLQSHFNHRDTSNSQYSYKYINTMAPLLNDVLEAYKISPLKDNDLLTEIRRHKAQLDTVNACLLVFASGKADVIKPAPKSNDPYISQIEMMNSPYVQLLFANFSVKTADADARIDALNKYFHRDEVQTTLKKTNEGMFSWMSINPNKTRFIEEIEQQIKNYQDSKNKPALR